MVCLISKGEASGSVTQQCFSEFLSHLNPYLMGTLLACLESYLVAIRMLESSVSKYAIFYL
jgi:hypothetical protein